MKEHRSLKTEKRFSRHTKEAVIGYLFAAPAILGFLLLTLYPMLASLYYSFNDIITAQGATTYQWVGLQNYKNILTDPIVGVDFRKSLSVTLFYAVVNVVLVILFCLACALLLNRKFRGRNLLRGLYFLPSVIPMVATGIVWKMLLQNQAQGGLVNWFLLKLMKVHPVDFINSPEIFTTLFLMSLWTCGGTTVVLIAALQDVPKDQLESIEIDGGNAWHKFVKVTFPTIKPILFFQMIMCMMTSIQIYTQSVVFSRNGSPDHLTYFINVMIYDHAFVQNNMRGQAAAEAWMVFLVILAITLVLFSAEGVFHKDDSAGTARARKRARKEAGRK
ncbi:MULTISPECIES: carbohydrate ABC transporter permease [Caproicibacterium]|uniref:Sugar ABC transporter permease n=1 Tax=Caproicibacterium argilliputei TaxID=3030016 RepID=A0AA97DAK5_9FIRM|nr:sugar ABC transporter permease [Caproicibacterium argilliputei]WOC32799.1 sugar ABC transporter permease [Caproicibacterium argilliputei]